ncbi:MAG: HepT-like ribonuclease domain-containing protein, partial [Campylobacterota bacterium]|nr:HepT-like ribonuclease domain-containing protein [Campylobacterota bacterium]
MYDSTNMLHILTILEAIEKIFIYAQDFDNEEDFYSANKQLNFNATVNLLIAIGEENKKIDSGLKTSTVINWKNVSAMRDKIAHNYRGVDESLVWNIIQEYLPKLKIALVEVIPKIENHQLYLQEALESQYYEDLGYLR